MLPMKSLLILFSYHHNNTEKIANVFARILNAQIKNPKQVSIEELLEYDLIGFGSGIYSGKHHKSLLDLVDRVPHVTDSKAFIFSTCSFQREVPKNHKTLREELESKGFTIIGEFGCPGFNTNSFIKYFGGMNKGRPNAEDIRNAEEFAQNLKQTL